MTTRVQRLLSKLNRTIEDLENQPLDEIAAHTDGIRGSKVRLNILQANARHKLDELEQS